MPRSIGTKDKDPRTVSTRMLKRRCEKTANDLRSLMIKLQSQREFDRLTNYQAIGALIGNLDDIVRCVPDETDRRVLRHA